MEVSDLIWKVVLLAVLILCPVAVALGVTLNANIIKAFDATASQASEESQRLLEPIDSDVPGGKHQIA